LPVGPVKPVRPVGPTGPPFGPVGPVDPILIDPFGPTLTNCFSKSIIVFIASKFVILNIYLNNFKLFK
jgi:hypothetical protein